MRINRNIVECKGVSLSDHRKGKGVLIETSWNVKEDKQADVKKALSVLIETSWNVKLCKAQALFVRRQSINRNIVECKEGRKAGQGCIVK